MKVKCDYCDNYIEITSETCECCGAPNSQYKRTANFQPETIEQLKDWYVEHNLPNENVTRFFIGKDYRGARAFGIYQDKNGDFVVYKNKSNGTRVERYRGDDETFAVNELYQKLRAEIANQKARNSKNVSMVPKVRIDKLIKAILLTNISMVVVVVLMFAVIANIDTGHKNGYYQYGDQYYYYYDSNFYQYDDEIGDWTKYGSDFADDVEEYYVDDEIPDDLDTFTSSAAYEKAYQEFTDRQSYDDDDWDSSSSWDSSDSWDSGSTDWDSDW